MAAAGQRTKAGLSITVSVTEELPNLMWDMTLEFVLVRRINALQTLVEMCKAALSILTAFVLVSPSHAELPPSIEVGTRPESITRGFDGDLFISVMEGKEPGDAVIKRLDGDQALSVFAKGFDEPKGLAFVGGHLVVSDLQRLWKIDAEGKATVLAEGDAFPEKVNYLNDVAAIPGEDAVYVSDMGANTMMKDADGNFWPIDSDEAKAIPRIGRIYKVTLEGEVSLIIEPSELMLNPNGVGVGKDKQLIIGDFFTGNILEWKNNQLDIITTGIRGADTVEQGADGTYYLSSWTQGKVWSYHPASETPKVLMEGLQSAADFYYDREKSQLLVPDMLAGRVYTLDLK